MAITAALKRSYLEASYATSTATNTPLRQVLRSSEDLARGVVSAGSIKVNESNRHRTEFFDYGPGHITSLEQAELFRWLIDKFGESQRFLLNCANYGLDAFVVENNGFPQPIPAPVNPAITIDDLKWRQLCTEFSVDPTKVVNVVVADPAVFLWMMEHIYAVTEWQHDFIWTRIPPGLQYV